MSEYLEAMSAQTNSSGPVVGLHAKGINPENPEKMDINNGECEQFANLLQSNRDLTKTLFQGGFHDEAFPITPEKIADAIRLRNEYGNCINLPPTLEAIVGAAPKKKGITTAESTSTSTSLTLAKTSTKKQNLPSSSLVRKDSTTITTQKPEWHAPWKLARVISGHLGWVRALAVEPDNQWFVSGAGDRTIKIWDLATGQLRLTLTGHISTVRGLAVSPRHPYLFSCGEDKMVKCWDLETNKVIRHYHGHLSGVYTLSLHPTLDVLVTGGRDGVARVWDMRTRSNIHVLSGHKGTVSELKCQEADPQVITSSLDSTVRLWDLAAGKTMGVLTHHKKGVRALTVHPKEFTFATGSTGSIKQWKCPEGAFMQNFDGHNSIINTLAVNEDNVLFSGGKFSQNIPYINL